MTGKKIEKSNLTIALNVLYTDNEESVLHRQFLTTLIFSISLKFEACCITVQWDEFRIKTATLCLHAPFWYFFIAFSSKNVCFYHFNFFF